MSLTVQLNMPIWCDDAANERALEQLTLLLNDIDHAIAATHPLNAPVAWRPSEITQPDRTAGPLLLILRDDSDERQSGSVIVCSPFGSIWQTHSYTCRVERDSFLAALFASVAARGGPMPQPVRIKPTFIYRAGSEEPDRRYERYQNIDAYQLWSPSMPSADELLVVTHLPIAAGRIVAQAQHAHIERLRCSAKTGT